MWPLWAYIVCGIGVAWLFLGFIGLLVYLHDKHGDLFFGAMVILAVMGLGSLFGYLKYEDDLKKYKRPPAEAPAQ